MENKKIKSHDVIHLRNIFSQMGVDSEEGINRVINICTVGFSSIEDLDYQGYSEVLKELIWDILKKTDVEYIEGEYGN